MTRHVLAIADLADEEIEEIFRRAEEMEAALAARKVPRLADGAIMATLFYEPSTRTRLSFETAMWRLGGAVISAAEMKSSSAVKGETLADTAKVVSSYADLLVLRHIWDGAARVAAEHADVPVINAGDGSHEHPTQTLCDLYTLRRSKGSLQGLTVAVGGDLKRGRTVHSLVRALARFKVNIVIVPAQGMELPEWFLRRLAEECGYRPRIARPDDLRALATDVHALYLAPAKPHQLALFTDTEFDLEHGLAEAEPITLDALYMTRPQRERQDAGAEAGEGYLRVDTDTFQDPSLRNTLLMHPLPRTGEISSALDRDPRSVYFRQAAYGVPVRMALVSFLLSEHAAPTRRARPEADAAAAPRVAARCANPNCITRREEVTVERRFQVHREPGGGAHLSCTYCDHETGLEIIGNRKSKHYNVFSEPMHGYLDAWLRDDALVIFESVKQAEEAGYRPYKLGPQKAIMSAAEIADSIGALTEAIVGETAELKELVIVGVRTAGAFIARRIADRIQAERGATVDVGVVDVHGGREGIERWVTGGAAADPIVVDDRVVVLVDDVINTGWTAKDALAIIWRAGRPRAARLAVLIDRGHRQLPIKPTYVGKHLPTAPHERVRVRLRELDREHRDTVVIYSYVDPKVAA
jgi:aspartate carbamoyltransferase catalytic subunit